MAKRERLQNDEEIWSKMVLFSPAKFMLSGVVSPRAVLQNTNESWGGRHARSLLVRAQMAAALMERRCGNIYAESQMRAQFDPANLHFWKFILTTCEIMMYKVIRYSVFSLSNRGGQLNVYLG